MYSNIQNIPISHYTPTSLLTFQPKSKSSKPNLIKANIHPLSSAHITPDYHQLAVDVMTVLVDQGQQGDQGQGQGRRQDGLVGDRGVRVFQGVRQAIVGVTQRENVTHEVHKVLYLIFTYFKAIAGISRQSSTPQQHICLKNKTMIQWLTSASKLFHSQVSTTPIFTPTPKKKKPTCPPHPTPYILEQNPYIYLLQFVHEYNLITLSESLQHLTTTINQTFENYGEMRDNLIARVTAISNILSRRIFLEMQILGHGHTQGDQGRDRDRDRDRDTDTDREKVIGFVSATQSLMHVPQEGDFAKSAFGEEDRKYYEEYEDISCVLKCISSILLGNQTFISQYSHNNIYLQLALRCLYTCPQPLPPKQICLKHLQTVHNLKEYPKLESPHNYLLQLISLPLFSNSHYDCLVFHSFFQDTFAYFRESQFFGYLAVSIVFRLGVVPVPLPRIDEEYEGNVQAQLILASLAIPTNPKQSNPQSNPYRMLQLNQSSQQLLNHQPLDSPPPPAPTSTLPPRPWLFLLTISFYKNMLYKPVISQSLHLQYKMDSQLYQQDMEIMGKNYDVEDRLAFGKLPLHQVIYNLGVACCGEIGDLGGWTGLAGVALGGRVADYFVSFVTAAISNIMATKPDNWLIDSTTLQLMTVQLQLTLLTTVYNEEQDNQDPIYSTYTLSLLHNNYLTSSTLYYPFDYTLLSTLQQLAGRNSRLVQISQFIGNQFVGMFGVFFQLESLTKRGKWDPEQIASDFENAIENQQKEEGQGYIRLINMVTRMHRIQKVLLQWGTHGCGEVVRVVWEIFEDYQALRNEYSKKMKICNRQQKMLEQLTQTGLLVLGALRDYIRTMSNQGYISQQISKFKKLLS